MYSIYILILNINSFIFQVIAQLTLQLPDRRNTFTLGSQELEILSNNNNIQKYPLYS